MSSHITSVSEMRRRPQPPYEIPAAVYPRASNGSPWQTRGQATLLILNGPHHRARQVASAEILIITTQYPPYRFLRAFLDSESEALS